MGIAVSDADLPGKTISVGVPGIAMIPEEIIRRPGHCRPDMK
jgi:hypothetical protein